MTLPAPIAAYSLDLGSGGATTVVDESGNGRDLTITGTPTWTTGHTAGGLQLPSNGSAAAATSIGNLSACTIECWYRPATMPAGNTDLAVGFFTGGGLNGSSQFVLWAQRGDFGTPNVLQGNYRAGSLQSLNGAALTAATWVHLALTYDGSTVTLYKDGVSQQTGSWAGGSIPTDYFGFGTSGAPHAVAIWDDVRVYSVALTGAQVIESMTTPVGGSGTTTVTKTVNAANWNVRGRVLKTSVSTWSTRARVVATPALSWNVRQRVTRTADASWNVRTAVPKTASSSWSVRVTAGPKTVPSTWATRQQATPKTVAISWQTIGFLGKQLDIGWNVRGRTSKTATSNWATRAAVSKNAGAGWQVRAAVGKAAVSSWAIRSVIGKNAATGWSVRTAAGKTLPANWNVRAWVGLLRSSTWNIDSLSGTRIKQVVVSWNTGARGGRAVSSIWAVRNRVQSNYALTWSVKVFTGKTIGASWGVRARIVRTAIIRWDTLSDIVVVVEPPWVIHLGRRRSGDIRIWRDRPAGDVLIRRPG